MRRRVAAIIFDWGNTLVDYPLRHQDEQIAFLRDFLSATGASLLPAMRRVLAERDLESKLLRFNAESPTFAVRPLHERLRALVPAGSDARALVWLERTLCEVIFRTGSVVPGAETTLAAVRARGLKVGIVSNTPWGTPATEWRRALGEYEFVRRSGASIVLCGDVGYRKPHPAGFLRCCDELGVAPVQTAVVGDALSDLEGARRAGCLPIWLDRNGRGPEAVGDDVETIDGLKDLPGLLARHQ